MARLPRKLRDIAEANKVLEDLATRLDNLSKLEDLFDVDPTPIKDIDQHIQSAARFSETFSKNLQKAYDRAKLLRNEQKASEKEQLALKEKIIKLQQKGDKLSKDEKELLEGYQKQLKEVLENHKKINKEVEKLSNRFSTVTAAANTFGKSIFWAFDKIGKFTLTTGLGGLTALLAGAGDGFERVYELSNRWTKAIGALNVKLGSMSPNMRSFTKEAIKTEGTIRGLTDNFGEGLQMAEDFAEGMGRILPKDQETAFLKFGTMAARGFGIGSQAAGELAESMYQIGQSGDDMPKIFGQITAGAKAAGVPVNKFAREIAQSREFMVSFGKEGQKSFFNAAAYANKLGIQLQTLKQFTKLTDNFDSAAKAAAQMNTVFGTSIDAMQLMLEDDPGKRVDMVRQAMLSQGKSFDQLTRQERNLVAETVGMSEDEVAGLLKSGKSYDEFLKDQNRQKRKQVADEKLMQQALLKTAQVIYPFGQMFDEITRAMEPLLDGFMTWFGVKRGRGGGLDWGGFRNNMNKTKTVIEDLFSKVAKNQAFKSLTENIMSLTGPGGLSGLLDKIDAWIKSDSFDKVVTDVSHGMSNFFDVIKSIFNFIADHKKIIFDVFDRIAKFMGGKTFGASNISLLLGSWAGLKVGKKAFDIGGGLVGGAKAAAAIGQFTKKTLDAARGIMSVEEAGAEMVESEQAASQGLSDFNEIAQSIGAPLADVGKGASMTASKFLGSAGLVAAAGALGYGIGRLIGHLNVGGQSIDKWTQDYFQWNESLANKVLGVFSSKETPQALQAHSGFSDQRLAEITKRVKSAVGGSNDVRDIETLAALAGNVTGVQAVAGQLGMDPQDLGARAEAANRQAQTPEFKAESARVHGAVAAKPASVAPSSVAPPAAPSAPKNFAAKKTKQSSKFTLVAGDVYLDGKLVGRALPKALVEE